MDESIASRFSVQLSRPRKLSTSESDSENDFQVAVDRLPEKFQRKQKDKTTGLHIQLGDLSDIASAASPKSPGAYSSDGGKYMIQLPAALYYMAANRANSVLKQVSDKERSETVLSYGLNTSEIPPNIDFYRMTAEKLNHSKSRPSMGDLLDGTIFKKPSSEEKKVEVQISVDDAEKEEKADKSTERKKFGWIEGVFVRCLQNIIGVILYLRLAWVAGQAGLLLGSLVILLASVVTTITTISTSAITTNGEIKGGGVYYLISRTLGPEFGGSIGLIFYCANAVGAALYLVGFAETVRDLLVEHGFEIFDGGINDVRILGVGLCAVLMAIIFIGVSFESKMQQLMMVPFVISVLAYVIGSFIHTETKALRGFTGYSWNTFKSNLVPNFRGETFFTIFSIYFPAATGIMAGANISGDLKNPQMAIPRGTLLAIFASTLIYLGTLFCAGATFVREADGVNAMQFENGKLLNPNCTASDSCKYGLMNNFQTLTDMSIWGPLITVGIFASTVSSALGSMVSAPKVFQAVASDNLFPYLGFFSKGSGKNNDPRRAYVLSFLITVSMILIGNLNTIAPIISNFFLCSYTLINYACFDASYSETPGFRPAFKFYNMWVSLACSVICVVIMFIMSWVTALMTIFVFAVLYIFLKKHKPDVNWGSSTQANQYKTTLQGLYRMTKYDDHVKNYRPQILLMSGDPSTRPGLVDFAASITRGSSLMVCANVLTHVPTHRVYSMMRRSDLRAHHWLKERGIKSFCGTVSATDLHTGTTSLAQSVGVGKMVPNILMLGYKSDWTKGRCKLPEINAYFKSIQTGFDMNMSVVVLRNRDEGFDVLDAEKRITRACAQLRKGSPPKGRLSLNPEKHGDLFQGGPRQIFKTLKSRASGANIAEMNPTKAEYVQEHFNEEEKTAPRPSTDMSQVPSPFCVRIKKATIDVWWLSDDGGLTLLLPHLLTLSKSYLEGANLRVFTVSSNEQIESEQASMAALMNKFRIVYKDLHIIADMGGKPHDKTLQTFNTLIEPFLCKSAEPEEGMITEEELKTNKGKTYRQLRCGELLHKHSEDADLLVINLPVPTRGTVSSALYMSWLEMMSRGLPPVLMVRGNHTSVLTFYS